MVDRLLRHVESEVTKEILNPKGSKSDIQYDVTLVVSVGIARLRFGSAHTFTNPLIETRISQVSINSSALLSSKTGWFVPEKDFNAGDGGKLKGDNGNNNQIHFESVISASYLNAKHNHTESLIDPFPCYSSASFRAYPQDGDDGDAKEGMHSSTSYHLFVLYASIFFFSSISLQLDLFTFISTALDFSTSIHHDHLSRLLLY